MSVAENLFAGSEPVWPRFPRGPGVVRKRAMLDDGVLVITSGPEGNVIRLLPPLVITDAELEHGLDVLEGAVRGAQGR